ncbi:polysaccharide pyruvyl transferase family protein [Clostridium sp. Marseille-P3244]|uniref:polysaccharide pyruvyl transferase family protein n=1 Tax=Clostridium sp. Marseille-P3244 TaxID=1871020 RepID=UPI000930F9C5|nr:polysaccharide pyruvyl transferase family protein [Clostridium sp. Marseille-P3244]
MKIGIVTVHDSNNYGSFLQAYALQRVFQDMGHEVYFAVTRRKEFVKGTYIPAISLKKLIRHPVQTLKNRQSGILKWKAFLEDQKVFREISGEELDQMDCVVLGSDEIWNVQVRSFQNPIFYGRGQTKAVAYGVSVGRATYEDITKYPELVQDIRQIRSIMVRDTRTQSIIEKICSFIPETVCDPTFLVPRTIFKSTEKRSRYISESYLLIYSYSISRELQDKIQEFARANGLKTVSACFYYSWADYNIMCGPLEFCRIIEEADYVITTTFHGTIFSVLNEKQFVSLPASIKTNDLLVRLGMEERLIENSTDLSTIQELLQKRMIDYGKVNCRISEMRENSLALLKKSMESTVNEYGKTL